MVGLENLLIVIFGITGDLAKKKLLPAIYRLIKDHRLGRFAVIGNGRRDIDGARILEESRDFIREIDEEVWKKMRGGFYYFRADISRETEYRRLTEWVRKIEEKHRLSGKRLFYFATSPEYFEKLSLMLRRYDIVGKGGNWVRVVFEKPFGWDLESAVRLETSIGKIFQPEQIFRLDHYLGKEGVRNIVNLRFADSFFSKIWDKDHLDHVQLILSEDFGVEGRGDYYDRYGALRDVVQNHLFQILAMVAMEAPRGFDLGKSGLAEGKLAVLKKIKVWETVFGQYKGYRSETGVAPGSTTETAVALKITVDNPRWQGIPFYVLAGKYLPVRLVSVFIQFKKKPLLPEYLVIQIHPDEGIYLVQRKAGKEKKIYRACVFGVNTPEAYESLLGEVIAGRPASFVSAEEIFASWRVIDEIYRRKPPVVDYRPLSLPEQVMHLIEKDGRRWHFQTERAETSLSA